MARFKHRKVLPREAIVFHVSPEVKLQFTSMIYDTGMNVSEYLRAVVDRELKKHFKKVA